MFNSYTNVQQFMNRVNVVNGASMRKALPNFKHTWLYISSPTQPVGYYVYYKQLLLLSYHPLYSEIHAAIDTPAIRRRVAALLPNGYVLRNQSGVLHLKAGVTVPVQPGTRIAWGAPLLLKPLQTPYGATERGLVNWYSRAYDQLKVKHSLDSFGKTNCLICGSSTEGFPVVNKLGMEYHVIYDHYVYNEFPRLLLYDIVKAYSSSKNISNTGRLDWIFMQGNEPVGSEYDFMADALCWHIEMLTGQRI